MKVLQCHSRGDQRFSALYAKVTIDKVTDTIENFYQKSKRDINGRPLSKGKKVAYMEFRGVKLPAYFLSSFYDLLWLQYFYENKDLYDYARTFDDYKDLFKGGSINNQENTIRRICKLGMKKVKEDCKDFMTIINSKNPIIYKDILLAREDIIVHQTNCMGVMGCGVALSIKNKYPEVFKSYKNYCDVEDKFEILGTTQICSCNDGKKIANLFGQYTYGRDHKQTINEQFEKAIIQLHDYAKENNLSVAIPYKIGCNNAGGDWKEIYTIIAKVFNDYPFVLYKI